MNKKTLIGVGVIAAIIIIALLAIPKGASSPTVSNEQAQSPAPTGTSMPATGEENSLKGLLGSSASRQCTYATGEAQNMGKVYVANGKMRSDITFTATNQNYVTHMIVDGQTSYMWMDGQTTGYKMDFAKMQPNPTKGEINNTGQANIDPNQNYMFNCDSWTPDQSLFTLPANVQFTDFSAMMPPATPTGTTPDANKAQMQAACNQLPEPNKTQCLAALPK